MADRSRVAASWIPACAGMTLVGGLAECLLATHPRAGEDARPSPARDMPEARSISPHEDARAGGLDAGQALPWRILARDLDIEAKGAACHYAMPMGTQARKGTPICVPMGLSCHD